MKNIHTISKKIIILCAMSFAQGSFASFDEKFDKLVTQYLPNTAIGIIVQDPKTGAVKFERRGDDNFYPASNTKLFTAAAALKFFGPNFQYQTGIHAAMNKMKEGNLEDNIYIVFRGDPSFTSADLSALMKQFKAKGVNTIKGNIIIDDNAFDGPAYAPGWTWDSIPFGYSAPVTTIILNENKVRLKLNETASLNDPIKIELTDPNTQVKLTSDVIAVSKDESEHSCQLNVKVNNNDINISGCWPIDKTPSFMEVALDNPRLFARKVLEDVLRQEEIAFSGEIQFKKAPKDVPAILIKRSPPLKNLLKQVLAESNNLYSESLTKALGLAFLGQGSFQVGTRAIEEILIKDTKIDFNQVNLSDGSGQSRYNLVSPFHISQLLHHMYQEPTFSVFYSSLSESGKKGSLADRMKSKDMAGKIVAKTGSALGTSALSGYFTAQNGNQYLFSLLINQSMNDSLARKTFEDKLCQLMVEEAWENNNSTKTKRNLPVSLPVSKIPKIPV
ncbi:MAG: D-alanyl-D-alanine carboxypeptidase/D-alanyl-D-alanine-endopeptidase [Gammaproteobacteria bacterium]|jgi:D-alanyl-D-alanine carboxypeptidase/D-alanyl-D-alanine-endopeptidase (penicillin-binding protein 4)|nr:D-alanyl-D-alanine carboxypeptidase/D-alanyl-D-alanine-endopeptidase [Gammaproteobacteria bacterium]